MDTTNKGLVQRRYPEAVAYQWADGWVVYSKPAAGICITETRHTTARNAWRDAYQRLAIPSQSDAAGDAHG